MKTRKLLREDLPQRRSSVHSLHIPVLFNCEKRYIRDIHFGNKELCYLEDNNGAPVKIIELSLLTDGLSNEDIRSAIIRKQEKIEQLQKHIVKLKSELKQR